MAGRVENLKAWPKGTSGNPGGRPKKKAITEELERLLEQEAPNANGQTWAAVIAETLVKLARQGDVKAAREVADRTEGRTVQSLNVSAETQLTLEERREELRELLGRLSRGESLIQGVSHE